MTLTLKAAITAGQTTFDVLGADDLQPGDFKTIDSETVVMRTVRSKTLDYGEAVQSRVSVYRGAGGTRAAAHAAAAELATYSAGEGGGGVTVDNTVDAPFAATTLMIPGATESAAGEATLPTVVVSPDDPGAIGAGNLWLQSNAGEGGDDYYQLNVRNDADDGWFAATPITNTDRETYVTIASPDDSVELQINNTGEGASSVSGAEGFSVQKLYIANDVSISKGADAPTAGAGVVATVGSVYLRTDGGLWTKTGAGDTAWTPVFGPASLLNYVATTAITLSTLANGDIHLDPDGTGQVIFNPASGIVRLPTALPVSDPAIAGALFAPGVASLVSGGTVPVVPLTIPLAQDVIDALVALGLVSQSD